jgi:ATP-binding cassette subfamily B protein
MVWDTSRPLSLSLIVLRLTLSAVPVAQLWLGKLIVDSVVSQHGLRIWWYVGLEVALVVLGDMLSRIAELCSSLLGDRLAHNIAVRLMQHAATLDLVAFEDPVFYDKLERARRQGAGRLSLLATVTEMAAMVLTLISLSAVVVAFSPWFLVAIAGALVPAFLGEAKFAMLAYSLLYRWTAARRQMDYLVMLGSSISSAKEVKIFGLADHLLERFRELFGRFYQENRKLALRRAGVGYALNLLPTAGYYAGYVLILTKALAGKLTIGDLTFLAGAFRQSRTLIDRLFSSLNQIADNALAVKDLFDFFETKPTIASKPDALPAPRPIRSGFEFRNVSFAYPGSDKAVLKNLSFRFDAQERIALIGENGAGKTTLVKLLSRLYDPTEGAILLDGIDLRDYDVLDLRKEIGVIFQDYMRYDMSASDNIGFGRIDELQNEAKIVKAAEKSLADQVIAGLPRRYAQMLGHRFEGGVDLSAGQWQKIALGRAYMRDAQVLILDEPTASLDARAEYEVFLRFADLTRDRMAVLISHRFSTVRMADRILVLEQGRILEHGTHQQLVALGGRYAELFELQAAGYR